MASSFCHLHNHTEYSLLDGANRIPNLVERAKEMGMDSLAISDHGVMFGVMEFYMECKNAGIKPILGVEAYVAPNGMGKRTGREENETRHLLLLAKDLEGYRNLCKLSSAAALNGFYYKPRIDHDLLRKHAKGVIGTSACLGSEICQELLNGDYDRAQYVAGMYSEIFGEGNFFIELQDHGLEEQRRIKPALLKIAKELKLPLIATNDAHYLCKSDSEPHDVLLCIQTGNLIETPNRMKFPTEEFYLKSPEEMAALFADTPEAIENTMMIAEMCDVELGKQRAAMPIPTLPDGETSKSYLRKLATEQLAKRVKNADERALARLNYELEVIEKTNFEDYFLLVREFAEATRERGIYFGVRGSAAGSLVSFCIGITDVDPLEYDLTFERFLNPERVSMPDIDMDFEDARRDEIIKWVQDKYGTDRVAQIVTFGTMGAKAAIKDCGRVQGYAPQETDKLCKAIPTLPGWTIDRAYKEIAEFKQMVDSDKRYQELIATAKQVEGMARHCGVHAAGVVISKDPLEEYVPLYRGTDGQPITAFEMGILEKIGLLKMDFLGLSNLTVLARAVENIKRTKGIDIDVKTLEDGDAKTYEMLARGETTGVFQLEGGGMTRWVSQLKPQNVRELAAMIALYRPGPMEHIPRYIQTKFGQQEESYLDERMRSILSETYGVIVYQDQVLKLVQALAGFSLGKADILRRAMGKKDVKAMASMKTEFFEGAAANGVANETSEKIWDLLLPFAGYAFNKAHAVCYSLLAYQTAWLKANYPVEYMAALMGAYRSKEDRVVACIEECRRQKIPVLPPDVNISLADFTVEDYVGRKGTPGQAIRFGLGAIKGVGEGLIEEIIKEREENGPFEHLYEFCERTKPLGVKSLAVEAFIKSGALSGLDKNRAKLLAFVDGALAFADQANRDRLAGQDSLFGEGEGDSKSDYPPLPDVPAPSRSELLAMEKETMGIYVSDHPLRGLERLIQESSSHSCGQIEELEDGAHVKVAGVVSAIRTSFTKSKGEKMARLTLEDFTGQVDVVCFPATYAKHGLNLEKDKVVTLSGAIMRGERPGASGEKTLEIRMDDVKPLEPSLDLGLEPVDDAGSVQIDVRSATPEELRDFRDLMERYPGQYSVTLQIWPAEEFPPLRLNHFVDPSDEFLRGVETVLRQAKVKVAHRDALLSA